MQRVRVAYQQQVRFSCRKRVERSAATTMEVEQVRAKVTTAGASATMTSFSPKKATVGMAAKAQPMAPRRLMVQACLQEIWTVKHATRTR